MAKISFDSEGLVVDWFSFNLEGLVDPRIIACRLSKYFTPHSRIDDVPGIGFHGFRLNSFIISRNYQIRVKKKY